jgi:YfiH family protein
MPFIEKVSGGLVYMTAPHITAAHAFTTRHGGVSGGIYDALNLKPGIGDTAENVRRNYALLGSALGFNPDRLVFSSQVHGTTVRLVTQADLHSPFDAVPEADGLITADPGVPLFVFIADCVPILLHDPVRGAVGAVHAGWRGTVADIAGTAVRQMTDALGCRPADIRAAIGPCISSCCYETGDDVVSAVRRQLGSAAAGFITKPGDKCHVDLKGVNAWLLRRAGLTPDNIMISDECTACQSSKYWSHRVTGGKRGSQAAVIFLKGRPL